MGKSARQQNARLAQLRAEQARKERNRRLALAIGTVAVVVVVIGAIVFAAMNAPRPVNTAAKDSGDVSSVVTDGLSGVPAGTFDAIGAGSAQTGLITPVSGGTPLTKDGKPEVLYIGAEFCPYCASERWALTVALERFGSFSGLQNAMSSADDTLPNTPTVSYVKSTYTSDYLSFVAYETQDRTGKPLQTLPDDVTALMKANNPKGSIPWIDFGGKAYQNGSAVDGQLMAGQSQDQVASSLADPNTDLAKSVVGGANLMTAELCTMTGNKPEAVCTSPGVMAAAAAAGRTVPTAPSTAESTIAPTAGTTPKPSTGN